MQLIRHLPLTPDRPTAVAIGNFDGLHQGHQAVLAAMVAAARDQGAVPSVLTFEPHPRLFFQPGTPVFRLERLRTKLRRLAAAGVARVYMPHFNAAFAGMDADEFLMRILGQSLGAAAVVTGENFAFGRGRAGNSDQLRAWGQAEGVATITVPPVTVGGVICSSSAIRDSLRLADVGRAGALLGRPYQLDGRVIHGDGRGAGIGFPTANVALPPGLLLPRYGVYAVRTTVGDATYNGVANLGVKPTVSAIAKPGLEVHLFDTNADLYGARMAVEFVAPIRAEQKFDGLPALVAQIGRDGDMARQLLRLR